VIRLFTARIKLGLFDPPEMVPYNKIDVEGNGQRGAPRLRPQAGG
jgi:hypothetical protein